MPDQKISELALLTAPADDDVLVIVDVDDLSFGPTGTNKKITAGSLATSVSSLITLTSDAAAGSTSATVSSSSELKVGHLIAIGKDTSKCEIRKITDVTGSTVTWNAVLKWSHVSGETVDSPGWWVPLTWWGARPGDSTFDSFRNLQNAFFDLAAAGGTAGAYHGLIGAGTDGASFYSSRPLYAPDKTWVTQLGIDAYVPFAFDCTDGIWTYDGRPQQHFFHAAGQMDTLVSVNTATNELTLNSAPGSTEGEEIAFYVREGLGTLPGGIEEGKTYFCKTFSNANKTITLSKDKWGSSTVDITAGFSGEVMWGSTGNCKFHADGFWLDGRGKNGNIRGLGGFRGQLQQSSRMRSCWFQGFAECAATVDGQHSTWYDCVFFTSGKGLRIAGGKFIYLYGTNFEACSAAGMEFLDMAMSGFGPAQAPFTGGCRNVLVSGAHFELNGGGACPVRVVTIKTNSTPTAGTWTLNGQTLNWNATAAEIQTACDAAFGAGNCVVSGGPLPQLTNAAPILLTFDVPGSIYFSGWGPTVTIVNSITGGSYSVLISDPSAAHISLKGGAVIRIADCVEASVSDAQGNGLPFLRVSGAAADATNNNYMKNGSYMLEQISSTGNLGPLVIDPNRGTITRDDSTGVGGELGLWYAGGLHGGGNFQQEQWYLVGSGGRRVSFGHANATAGLALPATFQLLGAAGQKQTMLRIKQGSTPGTPGVPIEVADSADATLFSVGTTGVVVATTLRPKLVAVTQTGGGTKTLDSSAGEWQTVTVTDATAFTLAAPTNPPTTAQRQRLVVEVFNSSGGAMGAITWNAAFVFNGFVWTNPADTKKRWAAFDWNGTKWVCTGVSAADY